MYFNGCFHNFCQIFLLSRKQVRKSVDSLRKSQNVLPKTFKLLIRPHHDHGHIYDQT